jgi:hypothetical protein
MSSWSGWLLSIAGISREFLLSVGWCSLASASVAHHTGCCGHDEDDNGDATDEHYWEWSLLGSISSLSVWSSGTNVNEGVQSKG